MRLLVIGDLHGAMPDIRVTDVDAIIAPGDFGNVDKIRDIIFGTTYKEHIEDPSTAREWWEVCGKKEAKKILDDSLKSARRILIKLNSYGKPVFLVPGNWDFTGQESDWEYLEKDLFSEVVLKGLKHVVDVDGGIASFQGIDFIGYGHCNGPELSELRGYDNISNEEKIENAMDFAVLKEQYNEIFSSAKNPVLFISHNVPYNTPLDLIVNPDSPRDGWHYGSVLAREMIDEHQPLLCISGHIHEHYGTHDLGKTIVLNAGFGGDKNTLITIEDGKVKEVLLAHELK